MADLSGADTDRQARNGWDICACGHTRACHGADGCEVEVCDWGEMDCSCRAFRKYVYPPAQQLETRRG